MSYFETLVERNKEVSQQAAKLLARNSMPHDERLAAAERQASVLASRYTPTLAKMSLLRKTSPYVLVELGQDEQGDSYFSEVRRGGDEESSGRDFTVVEFFSEHSEAVNADSLDTASFVPVFKTEGTEITLVLQDGQPQWVIPWRYTSLILEKEAVLDYAEATITELEPRAELVWSAATNPELNPDLAEQLAALQQA